MPAKWQRRGAQSRRPKPTGHIAQIEALKNRSVISEETAARLMKAWEQHPEKRAMISEALAEGSTKSLTHILRTLRGRRG